MGLLDPSDLEVCTRDDGTTDDAGLTGLHVKGRILHEKSVTAE